MLSNMSNQEHESSSSGFALGILVGAVAGAGLALLFAPKAGTELRGEIGQSMTSLRDAAARRLRDVADRAGVEARDLHHTPAVKSKESPSARPDGRSFA